jgi:hypothetical protein
MRHALKVIYLPSTIWLCIIPLKFMKTRRYKRMDMTWPVISCQSKTFGVQTLTRYISKNLDQMKRIRPAVSLLRASGRTLSLPLQFCTQVKGSSDFINGSFDVQWRPLMGNWKWRQKRIRHTPRHRIHRNSLRQWSFVQTHYYGRSRSPLILCSMCACNQNEMLRHISQKAYCIL